MATIFDRDTLLDLTVNFVPLGIIAFFVTLFLLIDPWPGLGELGTLLMIGLHLVPFVGLGILTYIAGKAIAGDEQRSSVFYQGQAPIEGARTKHELETEVEAEADLEKADAAAADVQRRTAGEEPADAEADGAETDDAAAAEGGDVEEPAEETNSKN